MTENTMRKNWITHLLNAAIKNKHFFENEGSLSLKVRVTGCLLNSMS